MRSLFLSLCLVLGGAACASAPTQPAEQPLTAQPAPLAQRGLDAMLSGYDYPYPVQNFSVTVDEQPLQMAYMEIMPTGEPVGTVLLLHGKNFSGAYWESTIEPLVAKGFRVIAPDQIGFGKSSKPENINYSFEMMARTTRELLAARGVTQAHVIGHSMGGMLAARLAILYPEQVQQLVLVNPIGLEDWRAAGVPDAPLERWELAEQSRSAESIKQYMADAYFAGQWRPDYDPLLSIQVGWAEGPDRALMGKIGALTSQMVFTQPVVQDFGKIKAPTLLIIGQRDRTAIGKAWAPPEVAAKLGDYPALGQAAARAIPGAKLVALDGVGHVPQVEAYDAYLASLINFLTAP